MNAGPYLILHKVRGEPAFDIAERLQSESEEIWIIPTSGHRAHPWRIWLLEDLIDGSDINERGYHDRPVDKVDKKPIPSDWPDHYAAARPRPKATIESLAAELDATPEEIATALATIRSQNNA